MDNRDSSEPRITPEQAVMLCDRNFGIGADGVIFAMPGINGTDYAMQIFNSDGSEPEVVLIVPNTAILLTIFDMLVSLNTKHWNCCAL